uniref:ELM2 and Myb/SANT-like domain containing 1b n=1 Tax=Astatotilapia calliptera TaxID=8154 RepID=A0A3P8P2H0_ASTCA
MPVMSVPAQQKPNAKRTGKRITFFNDQSVAMKETSQHPDGSYYVASGNVSEPGQSEAASTVTSNPEGPHMYLSSVIFSPDKGDHSRGHYQQTVPMKWAHQEPNQQQSRAAPWTTMPHWGQNFPSYIGGVTDSRTQNVFVKSMQETAGLQPHQQPPNRAADKPAVEVFRDVGKSRGMEWEQQQQQPQVFQDTLKSGVINTQQQSTSHPGGSSVLQSFQLAFGQPKQHLPAYYQTFQGNKTTLPNPPNYSAQNAKSQHHLQQLQKQEQIQRQHLIQQQMQQQQILQHQQHVQQQLQQQQQIQHEQQQQKMQQQQQQLQIQQMQHQQLQQQNPHVLDYYPGVQNANPHAHPQPVVSQPQMQPQSQTQLRRSRRLSKEGGAPSDNPFLPVPLEQSAPVLQGPQNGSRDIQAAPTGVIQSTRRKRRVSQEVNLEMLAQKASERESPPSHLKEPHRPWSPTEQEIMNPKRPRDDNLVPLVIPVSVPVRRQEPSSPESDEASLATNWPHRSSNSQDLGRADHKPSVIVTRRRSLRNSLSDSAEQNDGAEGEKDDDGKKSKRRPRPEPLFIPPPKPLFIAPPVYSSITPYQSHLRSPVRLADNAITMPPYTPPPILSPVREGTGLYFSTFLSSALASGPGLPPPATPKSATRSLLRSNSCDITPPVLSAMSEATPVSNEPRINIGSRYQAEVPELRQRSAVEQDHHRAELVWVPLCDLEGKPDLEEKVEDLMHLACSSVLCGGGTNQELAHHCLYECKGDIMAALSMLMLRNPIFPKSHHLSNYHYSGSDSWTAAERRQFNKGIAAYKKDFFTVQKQVSTKTVAQCVEFYYTYKKRVKTGRNGTLTYGETEPLESKTTEEEMDRKVSVLELSCQDDTGREQSLSRVIHPPHPPPPSSKQRYESNARKTTPSTGNKGPAGQEGEFPCKKCGRIFYKVKSRSAHMKSHAEQEKKAAALRQKEAEERAAAKAAEAAAILAARQQNGTRQVGGDSTNDDSSDAQDEDDDDWQ